MPFQAPWRDYQKGDLLYGLSQPRRQLREFLGIEEGALHCIDQYAIGFAEDGTGSGLVWNDEFHEALLADTKQGFNWDALDISSMWSDTRVIPGHEDKGAQPVKALAVAKRKSKSGLLWITQNTAYHIHFCLDDIEMATVPAKNYAGGGSPDIPQGPSSGVDWRGKARSITGAELRWVYRKREDVLVQQKIQFWLANVQCGPPWEPPSPGEWIAAWRSYVPKGT